MVAARPDRPFVVGFAAETDAVEQNAREKLVRKRLDMIAANEVGPAKGFDSDDNALLVLWQGGQMDLPTAPKIEIARALVALIAERMVAATHPASVSVRI
jgi:phosphopantothenoylcysteine decarboxylase/phosphopantothenate--cysteine ligase